MANLFKLSLLLFMQRDEAGNSANGWFAKEYHWERIQTTEEFIESEELTDEGKQDVKILNGCCAFWKRNMMNSIGFKAEVHYIQRLYRR